MILLCVALYLLVFVLPVVIGIITARKGYEDERGFHRGEPK